jgi:Phage portal protein, SPP1 Gp6-like
MAMSPEEWLDRLAKAMDDRAPRLRNLRRYIDGDAPLPEGAEGCRNAYKDFQQKSRTNFGELIVDATAERLIPSGFTLGGEVEDDDQLRVIWNRNRMQIGIADVVRNMLALSVGYTIVGQRPDGKARITCERPEQVITEQDAQFPDDVRAALKVYRDHVGGYDMAYLHLPGEVFTYYRPLVDLFGHPQPLVRIQGGWSQAGVESTGLSFVPVVPFLNRGGMGEFESHIDVLDRINWNILQRLVITAIQAYRQRGIEEGDDELPEEDEDGNKIDYGEMFKPGPGSLWRLPKGAKLWESTQTDFTAILNANKDDIGHLAAVTRTPLPTLIPSGQNQSAEGAAFAKEGLIFKSTDRMERAKAALARTMGAALAIENGQSTVVDDVESLWFPVERQSLTERADAASKALDLPWRSRMLKIWQFSAVEVDAMETERAADMLNASLMSPVSGERVTLTGTPAGVSTVAPAAPADAPVPAPVP